MMKPASVTAEKIMLAVVAALLAGIMLVYALATSQLDAAYEAPLEPLAIPDSAEAVAEGRRLARVRGCFWCHGQQLEGQQYFASAERGVIVVAPDLTRAIRAYTPTEFARTVRHGVKPDNTSLQPAMPSFAFYNMSDSDLGAIMAYIASVPEQNGYAGEFRLLPVGWLRWLAGKLPPNVAELIDHQAPRPDPAVDGAPAARGRYLAESICTECHGDNGRIRVPGSPDLTIAGAYTPEQFRRLLRTGVPIGERDIDYHMVDASKYRYTLLTDAEVDALYAWFQQLALTPVVLTD